MTDQLRDALEANRANIEAGLAEAERELGELRQRERELETLIARAKAALGETAAPSGAPGERPAWPGTAWSPAQGGLQRSPSSLGLTPRTLHEAIADVLRQHQNQWMTVREIATEVNQLNLYTKRDGSPVEANQIHARTNNYPKVFEKAGPRVRLRASENM